MDGLINEILEKGILKEKQKFVVFSNDRQASKNLLQNVSAKIPCITMYRLIDGNCIELSNKTVVLFREEEWKKNPSYKYQTWDQIFENK